MRQFGRETIIFTFHIDLIRPFARIFVPPPNALPLFSLSSKQPPGPHAQGRARGRLIAHGNGAVSLSPARSGEPQGFVGDPLSKSDDDPGFRWWAIEEGAKGSVTTLSHAPHHHHRHDGGDVRNTAPLPRGGFPGARKCRGSFDYGRSSKSEPRAGLSKNLWFVPSSSLLVSLTR